MNPSTKPATWKNHLKVALPLACALSLVVAFVFSLVNLSREAPQLLVEQKAPPQEAPTITSPPPVDHPGLFKEPEAQPRYDGEFPRWNLKAFPEGWNADIARDIHAFFEGLEIGKDEADRLPEVMLLREELQEYLAQLGPDAIPTLTAILNAEGDFVDRRFILYGLGGLGPESEDATFALHDFFMARYEDPGNRSEMGHVIMAMEELKNDTSFDVLSNWSERGDSSDLETYRHKFIAALGEHPRRQEAVGLFVDTMATDRLLHARNKSAQALGKIRDPSTLPHLYGAAQEENSLYVKQTMLGSIGKVGSPNSIAFLEDQARYDEKSGVRLSAASAIRRIGGSQASDALRRLKRTEPEENVRNYLEKWLKEVP